MYLFRNLKFFIWGTFEPELDLDSSDEKLYLMFGEELKLKRKREYIF